MKTHRLRNALTTLAVMAGLLGNAQTYITVKPNSTTTLCQNVNYIVIMDLHSLDCGYDIVDKASEVSWYNPYGQFTGSWLGNNEISITLFTEVTTTVDLTPTSPQCTATSFNLTFNTYNTSVSGATPVCGSSSPTNPYIVTTNVPGMTSGYWNFPSFMSGTGPGSLTQSSTASAGGTGTVIFTGTSGLCPAGSSSLVGQMTVVSSSGVPATPTGFHYVKEFHQCYYNPAVLGAAGALSYNWSTGLPTPGPVETDVELLWSHTYSITVSASNACGTGPSRTFSATTPAEVPGCLKSMTPGTDNKVDTPEPSEINVFPNPANNLIQVVLPDHENPVHILILNMEGKVVRELMTSESNLTLETNDLPTGLYVMQLSSDQLHVIRKIQIVR
jgi:hypothetical protein